MSRRTFGGVLRIVRVVGSSMEPSYRSGDYVLVGAARWLWPVRPGDAVVYKHPRFGVLIKRVLVIERDRRRYAVAGTGSETSAAETLGPAPFESVIGRALLRIPRSGR